MDAINYFAKNSLLHMQSYDSLTHFRAKQCKSYMSREKQETGHILFQFWKQESYSINIEGNPNLEATKKTNKG